MSQPPLRNSSQECSSDSEVSRLVAGSPSPLSPPAAAAAAAAALDAAGLASYFTDCQIRFAEEEEEGEGEGEGMLKVTSRTSSPLGSERESSRL